MDGRNSAAHGQALIQQINAHSARVRKREITCTSTVCCHCGMHVGGRRSRWRKWFRIGRAPIFSERRIRRSARASRPVRRRLRRASTAASGRAVGRQGRPTKRNSWDRVILDPELGAGVHYSRRRNRRQGRTGESEVHRHSIEPLTPVPQHQTVPTVVPAVPVLVPSSSPRSGTLCIDLHRNGEKKGPTTWLNPRPQGFDGSRLADATDCLHTGCVKQVDTHAKVRPEGFEPPTIGSEDRCPSTRSIVRLPNLDLLQLRPPVLRRLGHDPQVLGHLVLLHLPQPGATIARPPIGDSDGQK